MSSWARVRERDRCNIRRRFAALFMRQRYMNTYVDGKRGGRKGVVGGRMNASRITRLRQQRSLPDGSQNPQLWGFDYFSNGIETWFRVFDSNGQTCT